MSMFRKPKKPMLRKVFADEEDKTDTDDEKTNKDRDRHRDNKEFSSGSSSGGFKSSKEKSSKQKSSSSISEKDKKPKTLLSFADDVDEEEGEVFQVKKSSHSKKVSRMLDKERRKKAKEERNQEKNKNGDRQERDKADDVEEKPPKSDNIQTEIRTDDFVLVVKKSEPDIILNGRAALCAGRDDMSDEDDDSNLNHKFSKPENLRKFLESGSIPDAAMINAARLARNKKRIQGEIIPLEEKRPDPKLDKKKGSRLVREEDAGDDEVSDDERVDMNAITGSKERDERRNQFYAMENDYSDDDSDRELHEWENQQIRKGVTGAQLVVAHSESVLSRFVIKPAQGQIEYPETEVSTSVLLERAYAESALENPKVLKSKKVEKKTTRSVEEMRSQIKGRMNKLRELNRKHFDDIDKISLEIKDLEMEEKKAQDEAPKVANKFKFYQEIRGYTRDFEECMNVKVPIIEELESQALTILSKHSNFLIERRRQDIRDQAKEMAEASKPASIKKTVESEETIRRAAEREGRRTRRRCDREKNNTLVSHLDGMSSDEEVSDQDMSLYKNSIEQLKTQIIELFSDTAEEFYDANEILKTFYSLKIEDPDTYKDAFINVCLPKVLGPSVRSELILWYPNVQESYKEIEHQEWYSSCMLYSYTENETVEDLMIDPDVKLVPTIIEKIHIPKITEFVENIWDPMSTTETLRLVGQIRRIGDEYPIRSTSKNTQVLFASILDKMKLSVENDVFIPIFPKQVQEAKTSFFQRQFNSGLKLFRNLLSWQGIIADKPLKDLAIASLLNRYLMSAMRVCSTHDSIAKAHMVTNTLPRAWTLPESEVRESLQLFIGLIKGLYEGLDKMNPLNLGVCEKAKQSLQRLHCY